MKTPTWLRRALTGRRWPSLERELTTVRDLAALKRTMGWQDDPLLGDPHLDEYCYPEDANDRRQRDAEVVGAACRHARTGNALEIGTSHGHMTAIMARNLSAGTVHTINVPPAEIASAGTLVTHAPALGEIGDHYRGLGLTNIRQILANSLTWEPDIARIDVAFIDGCHDRAFVISDTLKALSRCVSGSVVLWHDFNPGLAYRHPWIGEVVDAVDHLYHRGVLRGPTFHLRDSWVGAYRVP